jgi:signal transduction histidine kinase
MLQGIDTTYCNAIEYPFIVYYSYFIEVAVILLIVRITASQLAKTISGTRRKSLLLFGLGLVTFLLAFTSGNIIGSLTENWDVAQYGLFGMPLFIGILTYTIVRFKTFNIKILSAQALVWALWLMIGGILLVAQTNATKVITGITEIIAIIFGIMLIKSVKREVEQREELAKLNQELGEANVQLTDLNRQKSEFVSFASHDLKSPINIIKQFASLIADGTYKEPQKIQETIGKIKANADRATALVDDFLDIRKIEEGHMDYTFEVKDIVSFVKATTEEYAPLAKAQKNIEVSFSSVPAKVNVKMDATRLRQVIQNLLSNSLKYSEKGWIKVSITEEQNSLLVTVKDSGLGMDKALLPILFEQFHRDASVAKKIQGTGLGLYISKQIVVAHGGEIWAESEGKGMGSTFTVRLPKA